MKWGEYSSDVQFILQRSEPTTASPKAAADTTSQAKVPPQPGATASPTPATTAIHSGVEVSPNRSQPENIVREITHSISPLSRPPSSDRKEDCQPPPQPIYAGYEFNSADVRNSLDRKTTAAGSSPLYSCGVGGDSSEIVYKNGPPISSNGALVPPPYRDPPPPRSSPLNSVMISGGGDRINEFKVRVFLAKYILNLTYFF